MIKRDTKRNVSEVAPRGQKVIVKEFKKPGPWGKYAPDHRSWLANWRLELSGFPVPQYLGWLKAKSGPAFLVMEYIEGALFSDALLAAALKPEPANHQELDLLFAAQRDLLERLHRWGIVHEDFKTQNIIVNWKDGRFVLTLIDNDAVLFGQVPGRKEWLRNLRHIRDTLPGHAAVQEAFRRNYPEASELSPDSDR